MKRLGTITKENKLYTLFSFLFLFFIISSFVFYYGTGFGNLVSLLGTLAAAMVLSPILTSAIVGIEGRLAKQSGESATVNSASSGGILKESASVGSGWKDSVAVSALFVVALFLLQLPVFLAFYPGIIFYDIGTQVDQYETGLFAANHPLIHTLFMGYMKNMFENPNKGYAIATVIQLLIVDTCLAYVLSYVGKNTKKIVSWIMLVFIGINPVFSLLFISSTKDIIFAALLSVVFIDVMRLISDDIYVCQLIRMIVVGILMILMRSNASYAFIPTAVVLVLIFKKDKALIKKLLVYLACVIVIGMASNSLLIRCLDAYKGSIKEMMSIPAQIDGRIYNTVADYEEQEVIRKYIPEPEEYNYYISDPIKKQFEFDTIDSQCKHFLLDTAILALKHPIVSIDAVLYNTQGYWDMFHSAYQEDHQYVARSDDYRGGAYIDSKLSGLKDFYMKHFRLMDFESWNLLAVFAQMGIYVWMIFFALIKSIKQKKWPLMAATLLIFIYFLTLLLGPSAIMRYGLPFMILGPVALVLSVLSES